MSSIGIALVLTLSLYFSAQALNCSDNPCALGGYFSLPKGYQCLQGNPNVICTCPNGAFETDQPCRICNRSNPANNPCIPSPQLISCVETDDFGTKFACLCSGPSGPAVTLAADCNLAVTLTSTATTATASTSTSVTPSVCFNGGNFVDGSCNCPSGYAGAFCEQKFDIQLCERIVCLNQGVCANRNPSGPVESVCLCRYGTTGEYCQLIGILGSCTPGYCLNNGPCQETVIGYTRHVYCNCMPGFSGIRCENQYFQCFTVGKFTDVFLYGQGKYFECTLLNGLYRLERKSCPKGLRFNTNKNTCTY